MATIKITADIVQAVIDRLLEDRQKSLKDVGGNVLYIAGKRLLDYDTLSSTIGFLEAYKAKV
jgi:hypothetical protein